MATIRKMRGKYYSRVRYYNDEGKRFEKLVDLCTDKKVDAVVRNNEVTKVEDTINDGENWSFAWQNKDGKIKLSIKDSY